VVIKAGFPVYVPIVGCQRRRIKNYSRYAYTDMVQMVRKFQVCHGF